MRVLHTSDWHLGHTLGGEVSRDAEHRAFLDWLVATCVQEAADALLITGDIFDSATPPASAERMWFDFLARVRRACPAMDLVAIAGNHDSPSRLAAPAAVLRELSVHVIGSLPRTADGALDTDRLLIPIAGGRGLVAAVPFLRPIDIPPEPVEDPLAVVYGEALAAARRARGADQALIVTGHLYAAGCDAQFLSERRVSIGGQESASLRMFPRDISYVALGHIHRPQRVLRETIRYAGAPLALYLDEAAYAHQVVCVDFAGAEVAEIRALRIPRTVEILRIPARGAAPLDDVLEALRALPEAASAALETRPYLAVEIALARPEPKLRALVDAALEGKWPRLVQLHVVATGDGAALGDRVIAQKLAELDPRDVFARVWARGHAEPPTADVLDGFEQLLANVQGDAYDPGAS
jgi:DNA repair protein SbcD/Mre11